MSQVPSQVVLVNELPAWLSVQQVAAYCGVDHGEMYHKMLRTLRFGASACAASRRTVASSASSGNQFYDYEGNQRRRRRSFPAG